MDKVVLFFELGYIFNIIGIIILVRNIRLKKHIEGISYYTQLLFLISNFAKIFYFPHTVLYEYTFCWGEFIASLICSVWLIICMLRYKPISLSQEKNTYDYRILIVLSVILAVISNYEKEMDFEYSQFAIRFSIILEAIGLLPQIKMMRKERFVQRFMGMYLVFICLSRVSRLFFWGFQIWENASGDTYYTLLFADLFYIVLTGDFMYNFLKHRNTNVIPYN